MDAQGFLRSVLPSVGGYCAVTMVGGTGAKKPHHFFFDNATEFTDFAEAEIARQRDVYVALASFNADARQARYAVALRSFFLDVDAGEGKPYASAEEAASALDAFCERTGLPPATHVCSGYGLHAYWFLTEDVPASRWVPIAMRLKEACEHYGLEADPAVTADSARILRVPGTMNFKREPFVPVTVMRVAQTVELAEFTEALDRLGIAEPVVRPVPEALAGPVSPLTQALMNNRVSRFSTIVRKSLKGIGCNAIKFIVTKQAEVPEPVWFSGLSIAAHCEDSATAIHKMSNKHPEYSPEGTILKARGAGYPHTCATFKQRAPNLCKGCKLKIKSPIVLGHEILPMEPPTEPDSSEEVICDEVTAENLSSLTSPPPKQFTPPHPYFRGRNGGIYKKDRDEDGNQVDELVYQNDFYPTQRLMDANDGEVVVFKLRLPYDGEREFNIPVADLNAPDKFRSIIGFNGVVADAPQVKKIMAYAIRFVRDLQDREQANEARMQFGWTIKRDGFVAGNCLYTKNKVKHNPVSSATADMFQWIRPVGDLQVWRSVINALSKPGMEPLQFAALCGFGSPLMPYSGVAGVTVNLMSNASGTGKTTACQIANSVFGHPEHTMIIERDTQNAREHKMGVMNHLVVVADEMTNVLPFELSDMVYAATQGRGKDRMEGQTNRLRVNNTRWQLILLTNSNSSMASKLSKAKARADGELMRLMELPVSHVVIDNGDRIFGQLLTNYGVAGPLYAQWLVQNEANLQRLIDLEKERLWAKVGKQNAERFVIGTVSAVLVGAKIAQKLGLHDLDIDNLRDWAVEFITTKRETMITMVESTDTLLGEYINANPGGFVLVDETQTNPMTGTHVFSSPRGPVVGRYEVIPQRNAEPQIRLYLSRKNFRDYCVERQYTMQDVLDGCNDPNGSFFYIGPKKRRLLSNTGIVSPSVDTLVFVCRADDFVTLQQVAGDAAVES